MTMKLSPDKLKLCKETRATTARFTKQQEQVLTQVDIMRDLITKAQTMEKIIKIIDHAPGMVTRKIDGVTEPSSKRIRGK
jgi:hypothetical protein